MSDFAFFVLSLIAVGAQLYAFHLGTRVQQGHKEDTHRARLSAATAIGILAIMANSFLERWNKSQPQYDYAYLVPISTFNATDNLDVLDVALRTTRGAYQRRNRFDHVRRGAQSDTIYAIGPGDWTLDIDAPGDHGKVLQRLLIENENGKPAVTFSRVTRKDSYNLVMCQSPTTRKGIPPC